MRHSEVKGLVLRTTDVGEYDRMLTVYTLERGVISVLAKNARSLKSHVMSSAMQFCYASFILSEKQDMCITREGTLIEGFHGLRDSLEGLALGCYVLEVLAEAATTEPEPELLRLALNSLYAISNGIADAPRIKAAFEMRAATVLGFTPEVLGCSECGEREGELFFDITSGAVLCRECYRGAEHADEQTSEGGESHMIYRLTPSACSALDYAIRAPLERLFSYTLAQDDLDCMSRAAEAYLLHHLERGFKTLDFYNEVKR